MRFAIFPNLSKPRALPLALAIKEFLLNKGVDLVTEEEKTDVLGLPALDPNHPIDYLISIGGDGTILRVLHHHPALVAPIVGINLGSLGFMADIQIEEINRSLEDILEGRFSIDERIMIEGKSNTSESCFAVNEIVIHRMKNTSLIDLAIHVGGRYLNTFSADGLIISTPNGSTAYSLAAGGPILTPELSALVITPICPHTISNRPIVVGASEEITIEYLSQYEPLDVTYDGFPFHTLMKNGSVTISLSKRKFRLVTFASHDFFSTLRTKLGWTGKLRNS